MAEKRFENAEQEFLRLKGQLAAGRITPAQFDAALKELILEDAQGKFWMIGADSGKWYVHDGQAWVEATPPAMTKALASAAEAARPSAPQPQSPEPQSKKSRKMPAIIGTVAGGLLTLLIGLSVTWGQGFMRSVFLGGAVTPTSTSSNVALSTPAASITVPTAQTTPTYTITSPLPTASIVIITQTITSTETPIVLIVTATPQPPLCPGPPVIAFFTASPQIITVGQSTTLSWGPVSNATSAVIDQGIGGVPTPGSRAVVLNGTTTFTLFASGCGGTTTSQVRVIVNPAPPPPPTNTPVPPQFAWDFTPCNNQNTTSSGTEVFDPGKVFGGAWVGNGCAMRFFTGGQSSMQTIFTLNADPLSWNPSAGTWSISILHLSSSPGGGQPGYSPVRVSLNGNSVWQGSPGATNTGPGGLWAANTAGVSGALRQGSNTLRWDFLTGATTHYWLKSFRITWGK